MNLNADQARSLAYLITEHPGPVSINGAPEGEPGPTRTITINHEDRWTIDISGEIQRGIPA